MPRKFLSSKIENDIKIKSLCGYLINFTIEMNLMRTCEKLLSLLILCCSKQNISVNNY